MFLVSVTDFKNLFKMLKVNVVTRQRNIWCVCVRSVWRGTLDLSTQNARTHTKCYAAASSH